MTDTIAVLNAGSSSLKFSMFTVDSRGQGLRLRYRGAIEGIGSDPRFFVADACRAADIVGRGVHAFLATHNPLFPQGEAALAGDAGA